MKLLNTGIVIELHLTVISLASERWTVEEGWRAEKGWRWRASLYMIRLKYFIFKIALVN